MADLNIEGMALSSEVIETIIAIAAKEVEGVTTVGEPASLLSVMRGKQGNQGIEIVTLEDGSLAIGIHLEVAYGSVLPRVADAVRTAVADAVSMQVGAQVTSVDVYIDGIRF